MRLLLNGEEADIRGGSDAPRVYRVAPSDGGGTIQGDYTLNLKLPKTPTNARLLNFIGEYQRSDPFDLTEVISASLQVNGSEVIGGTVVPKAVTPDSYDIIIRGNNVGWADYMGDRSLRDLTFEPVKYQGVKKWIGSPDGDGLILSDLWALSDEESDFCMPLVGYGNFSCSPATAQSNIPHPLEPAIEARDGAGTTLGAIIESDVNFGLDWSRFKPALYLRRVIRQIFEEAGFSVSGPFLSGEAIADLAIPYTGDKFPVWNWGLLSQYEYTVGPGYTLTSNPGYDLNLGTSLARYSLDPVFPGAIATVNIFGQNAGNPAAISYDYSYGATRLFWDGAAGNEGHQFYAPVDGVYGITANGDISASSITVEGGGAIPAQASRACICLYKFEGPDPVRTSRQPSEVQPFTELQFFEGLLNPVVGNPNILNFQAFDLGGTGAISLGVTAELKKGEAVALVMFCLEWDTLGGKKYDISLTCDYTFQVNNQEAFEPSRNGLQSTKELQPSNFLPDIEQVEFLKGVFAQFGVVPLANIQERTITLDFLDSYFLPYMAQVDWTDKAAMEEATIKPPDIKRTYSISYKINENDALLSADDKQLIFTRTTNIPNAVGKQEIKIPFAYTTNRRWYWWDKANDVIVQFGMACLNTQDEFSKTLGELSRGVQGVTFDYDLTIIEKFHSLEIKDIYIEDQQPGQIGGFVPVLARTNQFRLAANVLYANYYERDIERRIKGFEANIPVMLSPSDISDIDVRRPIRIGNQALYIKEIQGYNPDKPEPVTVSFIRR